jgi:hypothetical protein
LAAIGICPLTAWSGCPDKVSIVTDRDWGLGAGTRYPPFWAALPTSWEAVYATQMETFCAVRPWSLVSRRAPWPG